MLALGRHKQGQSICSSEPASSGTKGTLSIQHRTNPGELRALWHLVSIMSLPVPYRPMLWGNEGERHASQWPRVERILVGIRKAQALCDGRPWVRRDLEVNTVAAAHRLDDLFLQEGGDLFQRLLSHHVVQDLYGATDASKAISFQSIAG